MMTTTVMWKCYHVIHCQILVRNWLILLIVVQKVLFFALCSTITKHKLSVDTFSVIRRGVGSRGFPPPHPPQPKNKQTIEKKQTPYNYKPTYFVNNQNVLLNNISHYRNCKGLYKTAVKVWRPPIPTTIASTIL